MAEATKHDWPDDDELIAILKDKGNIAAAARWLGVPRTSLRDRIDSRGLDLPASTRPMEKLNGLPDPEPAGVKVEGDLATIVEPVSSRERLGDIATLIRERGLDPDEWIVTSTTLKEWDALTKAEPGETNGQRRLRYWTVTLARAPHLILALPAVHVPVVKRSRVGPPASEKPVTIVVEGDHQIPYHDPKLHIASVEMLRTLAKKHRLAEHVYLGDLGDYPTISRHPDHPAAMAAVNDVTQGSYDVLREKAEATPNIRRRKLKGNHDWRVEGELLARAERMYGIKPADTAAGPELPALSLRRLLHLDALGIELVEDPRGWQHGEVELISGMRGLVVRHGWLTGENTAKKSMLKRGRSMIVGHTHGREHTFWWDPSAEVERQGVVAATMSHARNPVFPHFAVCDNWLQGSVVVTVWPDKAFQIEHARWDGKNLSWRDYRWSA